MRAKGGLKISGLVEVVFEFAFEGVIIGAEKMVLHFSSTIMPSLSALKFKSKHLNGSSAKTRADKFRLLVLFFLNAVKCLEIFCVKF